MADKKDKNLKNNDTENKGILNNKYILPVVLLLLILAIGVIIGLIIGMNSGKKDNASTPGTEVGDNSEKGGEKNDAGKTQNDVNNEENKGGSVDDNGNENGIVDNTDKDDDADKDKDGGKNADKDAGKDDDGGKDADKDKDDGKDNDSVKDNDDDKDKDNAGDKDDITATDKDGDNDAGKDSDKDTEKDDGKDTGKDDDNDGDKDNGKDNIDDKDNDAVNDKDTDKDTGKDDGKDTGKDNDKDSGKDTDNNGDKDKDTGKDNGTDKENDKDTGKDTEKDNGKDTDKDNSGSKDDYVLTYTVDNSWQDKSTNMFGVQFGLTNNTSATVSNWKLELKVEGLASINGWNGTFSASGNKLTVTNAGYNSDIYAGGTVVIGCNLGTSSSSVKITEAKLNGKTMAIVSGKVDQNDPNIKNNDNGNGNDNGGSDDYKDKDGKEIINEVKNNTKGKKGDDWLYTNGKDILDKDGKKVWLTGLNWFGYNTGTNTFDGLWNSKLVPTVKAIADHGFNLIRVPISAELINQWAKGEYPRANYNNAYNPELNNMNSLEIFDYFLALAEENGIKVMPDIHSAETNASGHNVNLWYTDKVKVGDYYSALEWMAARYADNDTIIAFDLKNEPHGKPYEGKNAAIWNDSKSANNWKYVAETAAARILNKNPNVLIMVEGIEIYPIDIKTNSDYHSTNDKDYYFNWWGGNLRGVADYPIDLGKYQNKLVYSPHDYGPTVYEQPWFKSKYTYDSLMKDCWGDNWFFIYEKEIAPLLIGEWGGFMREPNLTWMTYMRQLIKKYHLNHTFWCLNANSGDTGGLLLDDFTTWDTDKYNFVKEVLWQENGKFVGLDHEIPLGANGISVSKAKSIN